VAAYDQHILPVSHFSVGPLPRDGLVLGFAGDTPHALRAGVLELARALRGTS
jgi:GntR family transcriptional regulator / MocR family aminotransferase